MKFAVRLVEHVNSAGVGVRELHRLRDDGRENGFEVERRIDGLADLAERPQLTDRPAKLVGALPQLAEQPGVLDGDDGLPRKVRQQLDLFVGERRWLHAVDNESAHQLVLFEHRNAQRGMRARDLDEGRVGVNLVGLEITDVHDLLGAKQAAKRRSVQGNDRIAFSKFLELGWGIVHGDHAQAFTVG